MSDGSTEHIVKNIVVEKMASEPTEDLRVEIVERKGLGHPDTICDRLMNQISVNLCDEYMKRVGTILHHNTDKSLLAAGEVEYRFGGGKIVKPMLLVIGDRATYIAGDVEIPVNEIALRTAKDWFRNNLRFVNPDTDIRFQNELKKGSAALTDIFARKGASVLGANDTSAAVGYAPYTKTERIVIELEQHLNSKKFKADFPVSGEDIKVMGLRQGKTLSLTVAMAFVDRFVQSEDDYFKQKVEIEEAIHQFLKDKDVDFEEVEVFLNTLDEKGRGINGVYLTVGGTCADGADCGQVGRGNRANGVISLNRPQASEAAAGKNPVSHVGKIYNLLSYRIADEIYTNVSGIKEVYVWLLSQIGRRIDHPKMAAAQMIMENGNVDSVRKEVQEIIDKELDNINNFCMELAKGKISVC
jgi:S-adenosylmethionine synthetase